MEIKSITIRSSGILECRLESLFGKMEVLTDGKEYEVFVEGAEYWLPFDKFVYETTSSKEALEVISEYIHYEEELYVQDLNRYHSNQV